MSQARGLVPYAALAVVIVGASIVALVATTLGGPAVAPGASSASPVASATAAARPNTDLSPSGRLAYWRVEANGENHLWLANADNSRRRSVAKADQSSPEISRTKWSVDGGAVAYIEGGVRLVVVRVDGASVAYTLAPELRADGYRIVDHRSSPSGARIAATVQRMTGPQTDVYLAGPGGTWTRLSTTEDMLAADWLTEEDLLVHTTGGIVGRLRASGRDQLRPLTGLTGVTPVIGDDGRIYFLSGRVSTFSGINETLVSAASSSIWSMTADGDDLRREDITLEPDGHRLDGVWPGGGYLLHRGMSVAQFARTKAAAVELPTSAGTIERLRVAPDRRFALGFAGANLLRVDLKEGGTVANTVVLLGSVGQGDAWFPRTTSLARVTAAKVDVPAARYAFALGGHLWTMGADGVPSILRSGSANVQTLRRFALAPPQWSPSGDRLLTLESLASGSSAFQLIAVAITRDGKVSRYTTPASIGLTATWSPDGSQLAVVGLPATSTDPIVLLGDLTISILDHASGAVASTIPGREAYWSRAGIAVISNGTVRTGDRARDGQALELWTNGRPRQVTTVAKLIASAPGLAFAAGLPRGVTQTVGLTAAPDGGHLAVHINVLGTVTTPAFVALRARDGAPTLVVTGDTVADEAWSRDGRLIGYTAMTGSGSTARRRVVARDVETGDVIFEAEGRFAGWSPDGSWLYVARSEGLFAKRLGGGDPVRFSPYGVPMAITAP